MTDRSTDIPTDTVNDRKSKENVFLEEKNIAGNIQISNAFRIFYIYFLYTKYNFSKSNNVKTKLFFFYFY